LAFDDDASLLYALLVKRYQPRSYRQPSAAFSTIIAYAYAANKESHFEIVQSLLVSESNNSSSSLTFFLAHTMLAFTEARRRNNAEAANHLEIAQRWSCAQDDVFSTLPQDDRSFNLITYQSVVRCRSVPIGQIDSSDVNKATQCPEMLHEQEMDSLVFRDLILQRVPGPFEFVDDEMTNPCIRSCLRWCIYELKDMNSVPKV
jgi:hypothetical protein